MFYNNHMQNAENYVIYFVKCCPSRIILNLCLIQTDDKTPENDRSESIPELSVDSSAGTRQDEDAARRESASGNIEEATTDSNIPTNEVPLAGDDPRPCLQSNFSQKVKVQSAEEHRRINSMGRSGPQSL